MNNVPDDPRDARRCDHMWWQVPRKGCDKISDLTPTRGERGEKRGERSREARGTKKASRPSTSNTNKGATAAKKAHLVGLEVTDKSTRSRFEHGIDRCLHM